MVDSKGSRPMGVQSNTPSPRMGGLYALWTRVCPLFALTLALALAGATTASASRTYDSQITGFSNPWGVAVDSADNAWISDPGDGGKIFKYNAYPSQTLESTQSGAGHYGPTYIESLAVDSVNGYLYVGDSGPETVDVFDPVNFVEQWGVGGGYDHVAVDNSGSLSKGRVYISKANGGIVAFGPTHNPLAFSASGDPSKPYISGNSITGTPGGSFGQGWNIAVDQDGDIYVVDREKSVVNEFRSSGEFVQNFTGSGVPGGFSTSLAGVAVDPTNGNVLVVDQGNQVIDEFSSSGEYLEQITGAETPALSFGNLNAGIAVNSSGYVYVADGGNHVVDIFTPGVALPKLTYSAVSNPEHTSVTLNATVDPNEGGDVISCYFEYGINTAYGLGSAPCVPDPSSSPPESRFSVPTNVEGNIAGLTAETTYHYRVVAANANGTANGADQTVIPRAVLGVTTEAATNLTTDSAVFNGSYLGDGSDTQYYFQYGGATSYGHTTPLSENGDGTGTQDVSAVATGLQSHFIYHFRLVAVNSLGTTYGEDQVTPRTPQAPTVGATSSTNLSPTTADLNAQINPQGFDTTYHFEYGTTTDYGTSAPASETDLGSDSTDQIVTVHLTGLQVHVIYHFRLIATSKWGTTTTADQTFNFYPPNCPNQNVRQQTQANYLPDCRAYELVSAENAGGTQLYPGGPNTGYATSPSRFSYTGLFSSIPGSGGHPIDTTGDLYVATRTDTGWVTKYVGLSSSQAAVAGGPAQGLPGSANGVGGYLSSYLVSGGAAPDKVQNGVLTDPGMNTFLQWNDGNQEIPSLNPTPVASNAPFVFGSDGELHDRWPTNLPAVPAGVGALDCQTVNNHYNSCPGDVTASEDLTHFVFATSGNVFLPGGGVLSAPGSVYDNNTATGSIAIASKAPDGNDIPSEPSDEAGDPLQIPAVSRDGSHILIAAGGTGPCGEQTCPSPPCGGGAVTARCPMQASHLYMRVGGLVTYDVSEGHYVDYVGATADGSKVYFTSPEQLTLDDTDTSVDLYMWSESTTSLTLVSLGSDGTGNADVCTVSFVAKCGVVTYRPQPFCEQPAGLGGNCLSDNFVAAQSGDIYFFSPEQLDGSRGTPGQENMYDYRAGQPQYVATFKAAPFCAEDVIELEVCSSTPVVRIQTSPNGNHMAFITDSQVTQYDNAGHLEMYTYDPSVRSVICVSCIPSGDQPTSDVQASQDGLFMTNDGRTLFTTNDALVHGDTNRAIDVYEYVDGRPQLITPGTGETRQAGAGFFTSLPGLDGVSADGRDVYFATYDTLVRQDHNGLFLKFYDARTGGGFSAPAPPPPCVAADECHGPGSVSPAHPRNGTAVLLGAGGNRSSAKETRHRGRKRHSRKHRRRSHSGVLSANWRLSR